VNVDGVDGQSWGGLFDSEAVPRHPLWRLGVVGIQLDPQGLMTICVNSLLGHLSYARQGARYGAGKARETWSSGRQWFCKMHWECQVGSRSSLLELVEWRRLQGSAILDGI
jgi:hypothetical protein